MSNLTNRFSELSAIASAKTLVRTLEDMGMDPSGKRYSKRGEERKALWLELVNLASTQAATYPAPKIKVEDPAPLLAMPTPK